MAVRSLTLHGHDVGYRDVGDGPVVLLIHGMAGSSGTWRDVIPLLSRSYRVIAPDLLGHGESAKPLGDYSLGAYASGMRDLLAALGVESATVVGQSLGGGVAMQLSYQHPELTDRLVLVSSGGLGRDVSWVLRLFAFPGAEYLMPIVFPSFMREGGNKVSEFLRDRGVHAPHVAEMWRAYVSLTQVENRPAFIRTIRSVIDPGGQSVSAMDRIYLAGALPTLIMWGDADDIIPVEHAHAAHEAVPSSRLEIFEGVGHFPHVEEPERFTEVLIDFMNSTEPVGRGAASYRDLLLTGAEPQD